MAASGWLQACVPCICIRHFHVDPHRSQPATHPAPQADDGWKCVYYRGQPLADFRAAFERQAPAPGAAGGAAGAAAAKAALAPTRTSGRQRKKKRFDSDSEGEAYAGDALTDEAYAMFLSAAEHQARQAQQAQQAAQQVQQEVIVELPAGVEVRGGR